MFVAEVQGVTVGGKGLKGERVKEMKSSMYGSSLLPKQEILTSIISFS